MFFIFGTDTLTKQVKDGISIHKYCPHCNDTVIMSEFMWRKYFTFFFIPILPTESRYSVLTCSNCGTSYEIQEEDWKQFSRKRNLTKLVGKGNVIRMFPEARIKKMNRNYDLQQEKIYSDYCSYSSSELKEIIKSNKLVNDVNEIIKDILTERNVFY